MQSNDDSKFKSILWFGIGFLVCFALMKAFDRNKNDSQMAQISKTKNKTILVQNDQLEKPRIQSTPDLSIENKPLRQKSNVKMLGEKISETEFEKVPEIRREPANIPSLAKQFEISISESDVIQMESALDSLKEEVSISREKREVGEYKPLRKIRILHNLAFNQACLFYRST